MRSPRLRDVVLLLAGALVLSACGSVTSGTPIAIPSVSDRSSLSAGAASSENNEVPRVTNPKNLRGVDPCQMLTQAQLRELGASLEGKPDQAPWGETLCRWVDDIRVTVAPDTKRRGLAEVYARKKSFNSFQTSSVAGYPAVRADFGAIRCNLNVGVANDQLLLIQYSNNVSRKPEHKDTCVFAERIAAEVLKNLPAGG
ncbi:Protein of unknown function (DUF3558) [Streptoalloteichus tenebrarius]|uniref:DUF3558 domain-containing protein n=1 Tax=Streptoalloteichus tenebrarius (strain ATCC 17920 / DSM 40477 / JCM 4838 / CBS 697.72 / NBRC 16177 / NCIMB 11028 / NRRL B-12390 / A12253. 1 / ISP 5477) TaxID=1933 RepID=A0ABT1I2V2_STRSD|nr:DUF3558 domain-containing protein [Streptoalloteichus tenebrarius]MCP2262117.1 Protein of unknown function (DUF3558) [Streptoalloteichus tenebrarius]BFF02271.1 hypothetical protein GCM10020241_39460 [Streptoalloteichus tenebrarius]